MTEGMNLPWSVVHLFGCDCRGRAPECERTPIRVDLYNPSRTHTHKPDLLAKWIKCGP